MSSAVSAGRTPTTFGAPQTRTRVGHSADGLLKALVLVGWEGELKTDAGGRPKADSVIVPGCDPPDPSADGFPNAGVCCVSPRAEAVESEGWAMAGALVEFCVVPKTEGTEL